MRYKVKNLSLAEEGGVRINLAREEMPGLKSILEQFQSSQPLRGAKIAGCLHMTSQTAVLIEALVSLGAEIRWCSNNQYSTQDHAAAAMAYRGFKIFAWYGETTQEFEWCKKSTLFDEDGNWFPNMLLDDGAELSNYICNNYQERLSALRGITEETTSGWYNLNQLYQDGVLKVPSIVINNSITKTKFDNIYGCKESVLEAVMTSADIMIAGKTATVVGYGDVGKGCAKALSGLGANVQVVEIDPISALQACMEGYVVLTMDEACLNSHLFVTVTGNINVISIEHMRNMKDKVVLCNMGHGNNEIQMSALNNHDYQYLTPQLTEYIMPDNKRLRVLGSGAPANLACANGHPSFVMSTSFSNQVLAQIELWKNPDKFSNSINTLPRVLDERVASMHLNHLGAKLSKLTPEQANHMNISVNGPFKPDFYRY